MWCLTFSSLVLLPVCCVTLSRWNVAVLPAHESRRAALENVSGTANPRTSHSPARNVDLDGPNRSAGAEGELPTQTALTQVKAVASTGASVERQTPDARAPQTGAAVWRALLSIWIVGAPRPGSTGDRNRGRAPFGQELPASSRRRVGRTPGRVAGKTAAAALRYFAANGRDDHPDDLRRVAARCRAPRVLGGLEFRETPLRASARVAHVKRLDVLFQLVATVAGSFYWFNPLIWYALRRSRIRARTGLRRLRRGGRGKSQRLRGATCRNRAIVSNVSAGRGGGDGPLVEARRADRRPFGSGQVAPSDHRASLTRSRACRGPALDRGRGASNPSPALPSSRNRSSNRQRGPLKSRRRLRSGRRKWSRRPARRNRSGDASVIRRDIPFAEARIWAQRLLSADWQWKLVATTDAHGLFRFEVDPATLAKTLKSSEALSLRNHHKVPIALAASAAGFGFGLIELAGLAPKREELANVSFRLVKDVPVSGRILTMDGRPASGTSVEVGEIDQPARRRWTNTFASRVRGQQRWRNDP